MLQGPERKEQTGFDRDDRGVISFQLEVKAAARVRRSEKIYVKLVENSDKLDVRTYRLLPHLSNASRRTPIFKLPRRAPSL